MENKRKTLGVIGGLGPMASAFFYRLVTERTEASCDQEHIDTVIISRASTPDRTAYLTGKSAESPLPSLISDAKKLESIGADNIVITCNTSHKFIDEIRAAVKIPVPGIIEETADYLKKSGCRKAGIMATDGTVSTGLYQDKLRGAGIDFAIPDEEYQKKVTQLIYGSVKSGKEPSAEMFYAVAEHLLKKGCDRIILGCTELSVINTKIGGKEYFCDAMEVLAYKAIKISGGKPKNFPASFEVIE